MSLRLPWQLLMFLSLSATTFANISQPALALQMFVCLQRLPMPLVPVDDQKNNISLFHIVSYSAFNYLLHVTFASYSGMPKTTKGEFQPSTQTLALAMIQMCMYQNQTCYKHSHVGRFPNFQI